MKDEHCRAGTRCSLGAEQLRPDTLRTPASPTRQRVNPSLCLPSSSCPPRLAHLTFILPFLTLVCIPLTSFPESTSPAPSLHAGEDTDHSTRRPSSQVTQARTTAPRAARSPLGLMAHTAHSPSPYRKGFSVYRVIQDIFVRFLSPFALDYLLVILQCLFYISPEC
jgi:hypothetical protein